MKPPAFQFYADDFLAGTFSMSNEERGLYITLLCRQWTQGYVTPDEVLRLGSTTVQPSINHVLTKFVADSDGNLKNHRLEAERGKQTAFRALQSQKGKASAKARFNHGSTTVQPSGAPEVNSPSPSPSPIIHTSASATPPPEVVEKKKPKPPADPRYSDFIAAFSEEYENATNEPYEPTSRMADGKNLKDLLKAKPNLTTDQWRMGIRWCWDVASSNPNPPWEVKQTGTIAKFAPRWSEIVAIHATYQPPKLRR